MSSDFNGLNTDFLEECCGLNFIVQKITHGKKVLEKLFTKWPDFFSTCVSRSLLTNKHMAVLVSRVLSRVNCHIDQRKCEAGYDVRALAISSYDQIFKTLVGN